MIGLVGPIQAGLSSSTVARTAQDQRYYWEPAWEMNFGHALLARAPKVLAFSLG